MIANKHMIFRKKKQVKCLECKHYVDLDDAQSVVVYHREVFYCPMHRKPYDRLESEGRWVSKSNWEYVDQYLKDISARRIEVTEDGKPIGISSKSAKTLGL